MKSRIIVAVLLVVGAFSVAGVASRGENAAGSRTWTQVNFTDPVFVSGRFVMGPVLIVHDAEKMARGEACTTFYQVDPARGPQEAIVSFHCTPVQREVSATTRLTLTPSVGVGCKRLVEYQIAGESEAHLIPIE
jgi:hypothetical protein